MKPDLDKIRTLGNELKCMLETSNKFIKDSWLENYAEWMKVSYDENKYFHKIMMENDNFAIYFLN